MAPDCDRRSIVFRMLAPAWMICIAGGSADAAVTFQDWFFGTYAADFHGGPGGLQYFDDPSGLPFALTRTVQAGASSSTSTYDFTATAPGATFRFDFDHLRDGDGPGAGGLMGDSAFGAGRIQFTPTAPLVYHIDGMYSLTGSNLCSLFVSLVESNQTILFYSFQSSISQQDLVFEVGGQAGTERNTLIGAQSGVLLSGHSYFFNYEYRIEAASDDSGASANGWLNFQMVPEPVTVMLLGSAAALLLRRKMGLEHLNT